VIDANDLRTELLAEARRRFDFLDAFGAPGLFGETAEGHGLGHGESGCGRLGVRIHSQLTR
jgi:hypothetical protein